MTRGDMGRGSAGPRARVLDRGEVIARRAIVMLQPVSPERSAALVKIRCQLRAIDQRVQR